MKLDGLPEKLRLVVEKTCAGLTVAEISIDIGINRSSVYARQRRAERILGVSLPAKSPGSLGAIPTTELDVSRIEIAAANLLLDEGERAEIPVADATSRREKRRLMSRLYPDGHNADGEDDPRGKKCRCGLRLPCNDCTPPISEFSLRGWGEWKHV